jgi:hypothetical protein
MSERVTGAPDSERLVDAVQEQTEVLREIRDRMNQPPSHHREATVDPRYEVLRAEFLALNERMLATPMMYTGLAVSQEIGRILARVTP